MKSLIRLPLIFIIFAFGLPALSQEYGYTRYDITDGLAGSTVYCITQDKNGFIWVGTETGVSRFDGTHFKNFTTVDGLPDIEVLQIFGDSKGRVWMAPLRKAICYYYGNRMYNPDNDPTLRRVQLKGNIEGFAEDAWGNVLIEERAALHLVQANGEVRSFDSIDNHPIRNCTAICRSADGHFLVQEGQTIWRFSGRDFSFLQSIPMPDFSPNYIAMNAHWVVWRDRSNRSAIESLITGKVMYRPIDIKPFKFINYSLTDDSLVYFNEFTGVTRYNARQGEQTLFLPGSQVSRSFRDQDGNLWFTTLDHGIFRLKSETFRTIRLLAADGSPTSVSAIARSGNDLWVGNDQFRICKFSLPDYRMTDMNSYSGAKNRVVFFDPIKDNGVIVATTNGTMKLTNAMKLVPGVNTGAKSVYKKNDKEWLISNSDGVLLYDLQSSRVTDTLWRGRSTIVYFRDDTTYIGTMNGLYRMGPDKSAVFMGSNIPFLRKRISSIASSHDTLWVSSVDDAGVVGIRADRLVATITKRQGLTSDICRVLKVQSNILWIGTDKGLNKVELDKPGYPIYRYTSNDGLGSDMVNTICTDSNMVYVGTTTGLSYFDETKASVSEEPRLSLLSVTNDSSNRVEDTSGLSLPYKNSYIRFDFAAVSYRSSGNITYRYHLLGLDSAWKETNASYLEFPALGPGDYQFQIKAINKFGISSNLRSFRFNVITPFWKTLWFDSILLILFLYFVWLVVSLRVKAIRRRQEEQNRRSQRMYELEHQALQAQMNPHFVFNCLNSIQQHVFRQDIIIANKYISGLAKLVRATLNHSSIPFISLAEEIEFLSTYLSLEKLRFKDKMTYEVLIDPGLDKHSLIIPPMIVQPYVENSMRHGLRHKTTGEGHIKIQIRKEDNWLNICIQDNGIGRKRAALYKTAEHIEYQSKGMSLTADRIRMLNAAYGKDIKVEVIDLEDDGGQPAGTRVVIQFPIFDTGI